MAAGNEGGVISPLKAEDRLAVDRAEASAQRVGDRASDGRPRLALRLLIAVDWIVEEVVKLLTSVIVLWMPYRLSASAPGPTGLSRCAETLVRSELL